MMPWGRWLTIHWPILAGEYLWCCHQKNYMRGEASECVPPWCYGAIEAERCYRPVVCPIGSCRCGADLSSAVVASCRHMVSLLKVAPVQSLLTNNPPLLTLGFRLPVWLQKSYWTSFCHWISWAILIGLNRTYRKRETHFGKQESGLLLFSRVQLFAVSWTAAYQVSLSFTISQSLLKLMSLESVMPSNQLVPFFSCLQSFPASGSFLMSWLFASDGQSIGVSALASVLPVNIQDWFPLGWTAWISLLSKGFSRVFSNTTVQKHEFFGAQLSL